MLLYVKFSSFHENSKYFEMLKITCRYILAIEWNLAYGLLAIMDTFRRSRLVSI